MFSPLRWVGGKTSLLPEIVELLPEDFGSYIEPFLGGGALAFHLGRSNAQLSDCNPELINFYRVLADSPDDLYRAFRDIPRTREDFYRVRALDRDPGFGMLPPLTRAARFLYLNRYCFNGLWRVNSRGQNNTPIGNIDKEKSIDQENWRQLSEYLSLGSVSVRSTSFLETMGSAVSGDLVYADPPYVPISTTSNFTGYASGGFGMAEHVALRDRALELRDSGVKVMISNSYCPATLDLYKDFSIHEVKILRGIAASAGSRGVVSEMIATNY